MATIAKLMVTLGMDDADFASGLNNSRSKLNGWGESMRSLGGKMTGFVTVPLATAGLAAVKWAASTENAIGKTEAVFKGSAQTMLDWSTTTADAIGVSRNEALQVSSTFGSLFNQMDVGVDRSMAMSQEMVGLSADMAAFNDVSNSRASDAIMSGIIGEYESLQSLGVFLNEATVAQKAMEMGLADTTGELTEQDKQLARYELIMEQTTEQQGQFARESNSFNGKLAKLTARFKDVGAKLGAHLLGPLSTLMDYFEKLLSWFEKLSPAMQRWVVIIAAVAAALGPVLIVIGMMLPAIGALIAVLGFLLSPIGLIVIAIVALVAGLIYAYTEFETFRNIVNTAAVSIVAGFAAIIDGIMALKAAFDQGGWSAVWAKIVEGFHSIDWGAIGTFLRNVGTVALNALREGLEAAWPGVSSWLAGLPGLVMSALAWLGGALWDKGTELISGLYNGLVDNWPTISDWLVSVGSTAARAVGDLLLTLWEKGSQLISGLYAGLIANWPTISAWLLSVGTAAASAVGDLLLTLWDKGTQLIAGLYAGLVANWPTVSAWLVSLASTIPGLVGDFLMLLWQKGTDLIAGLYAGIVANWPTVSSWFASLGSEVVSAIGSLSQTLWQKGTDLIAGFLAGMIDKWMEIITYLGKRGEQAVQHIGSLGTTFLQKGTDLITGFLVGVTAKWVDARTFIAGIKDKAISAVGSLSGALLSAGADLIRGLIGGIESMAGAAADAAVGAVQGAIDAAKNALGINSPSKVFMEIGNSSIEGWVLALDRNGWMTARATEDMARGVADVPFSLSNAAGYSMTDMDIQPGELHGLNGAGSGQVVNVYYSVSSDEFQRLVKDAEDGGTFARSLGSEMAMYGGKP